MSQHTHLDDGTVEGCPGCFPSAEVVKWADEAMFPAAPMGHGEPIQPTVAVVSMTPNPLRVMAAANQMYKGDPVHSPDDVPRSLALACIEDMTKTTLQAPLEYVDIHFLIEGVTRAFTHQLVRQRTAVFSQESLRFAVKEDAAVEVVLPPSIAMLKDDDPLRVTWDNTVRHVGRSYNSLINAGIPAEDARGLLPTNIATRIHYKTNLRGLVQHAGYRLCSQAQYEWKQVWNEMLLAIVEYGPAEEQWQQIAIASLFKPICYQTGKCEFMGEADRYCVIRDRVEAHHAAGDPPKTWVDISPFEPLRYGAARHA